jgi:hypothetical protein
VTTADSTITPGHLFAHNIEDREVLVHRQGEGLVVEDDRVPGLDGPVRDGRLLDGGVGVELAGAIGSMPGSIRYSITSVVVPR